ncbi:MAG: tetratricopeptide repeat protein [Candidatus Melainabacteria bacterium]|nr:tetratricopeptide repeat protein [Candidatus Melainabacteria bacterium]
MKLNFSIPIAFCLLLNAPACYADQPRSELNQTMEAADTAYKTKDFKHALELYTKALSLAKSTGSNDPRVGSAMNGLAATFEAQGNKPEALAMYKQALVAKEASVGHIDPTLLPILDNLASFYRSTGDADSALATYKRALQIRESGKNGETGELAKNLNSIASIYRDTSKYKLAEQAQRS